MKCIMDEPQKVHKTFCCSFENKVVSLFLLQSADYLRETTYPDLPGLKYRILLLYYTILQTCMDSGADVHVRARPEGCGHN